MLRSDPAFTKTWTVDAEADNGRLPAGVTRTGNLLELVWRPEDGHIIVAAIRSSPVIDMERSVMTPESVEKSAECASTASK